MDISQQWLPNPDSAVLIEQFQSPKQLADHILLLNNNDELYNHMLNHKIHQNVSNTFLKSQLEERKYEMNSIVEDFECFVCQYSVDEIQGKTTNRAKQAENMCPNQLVYPKMRAHGEKQRFWQNFLQQGKCEANALNEFLKRNETFTRQMFNQKILDKFHKQECKLIWE